MIWFRITTLTCGLLFLMGPASAWAAVSRTGFCQATATSCTLNLVNTGDLKVCVAVLFTSTTPPTLPAGWKQVDTDATTTGGSSGAQITGCVVATSTTDKASGTWTGAQGLACYAYSGTAVGTSANCDTTGIGKKAHLNAKGSTTVTYPALSFTKPDGTSWLSTVSVANSSAPACPTGTTQVSLLSTGVMCDSNGPVTTWTAKTSAISSGTWFAETLEIIAPTTRRKRVRVMQR